MPRILFFFDLIQEIEMSVIKLPVPVTQLRPLLSHDWPCFISAGYGKELSKSFHV